MIENLTTSNVSSGPRPRANRRELLAVLGLAILACVLRVALIPYGGFITSDGVYYAALARNLLAGDLHHGISTYWPPFYPLLITVFAGVFRDPVVAGRLVSALAGGMLVVPVYVLARRFSNRRLIPLLAALFVVFEPSLIYYSVRVLTESVYTLLLVGGILVGWVALERGTPRYFFLTGLVFGLAYLTRPEALGYVALVCLIVGVVGRARKAGSRWVVSRASVVVLGTLLAAAPYLLYLRQETGRWTLTEKFAANLPGVSVGGRKLLPDGQLTLADILWAGARPQPADSEASTPASFERHEPRSQTPSLFRRLALDGRRTITGLYEEYFMIGEILPPLFLILIGVGLFASAWNASQMRIELYVGSFIFATFLGYAFTYHNQRYLIPLIPLALCWVANGTVVAARWVYDTFAPLAQGVLSVRRGPELALAVVLLIVTLSQSVTIFGSMRRDLGVETRAAEWIRSQGVVSPLIMATGPWPAFYTGGRHLYIPNEELPVVVAYAKRKKVDFIVVEYRWLATTPSLAPLSRGTSIPPELTLVYQHLGEREREEPTLWIFRVAHDGDRATVDTRADQ